MGRFWNRISYWGVDEEMGFDTARRLILLNRLSFVLFLLVFSMRLVVVSTGLQKFSVETLFPFIAIPTILVFPYLNRKGYYKISAFTFCVLSPVLALYFSVSAQITNDVVNIGHYYYPRMLLMGLLVLPLVLIDTKNKYFLYISLAVTIACILLFDKATDWFGVPFDPEKVSLDSHQLITKMMLVPSALIIFAFFFMRYLNQKYEKKIIGLNDDLMSKNKDLALYNEEVITQRDTIISKNEQLESANVQIETINKDLTDSILYAERIQRAVFRKEVLPEGFFKDSFIYLKPKSHVSGDFFYYKEITIDNKKGLVVTAVDCTGHGVPGGFLSMLGTVLLEEIIQYEPVKNAADILNLMRARIKSTLKQTGKMQEQKDGMDMALCIYYPETKMLDFSGARNPLCIVGENIIPTVLKGDRQPVGVYEIEDSFTNHRVQLQGGEMIYLFSDGLQDQFGGTDGKKLKLKNVLELMQSLSKKNCTEQKSQIISFLDNWTRTSNGTDYEQVDDIVLIGMRV